jgi:hypothetical protein
VAVAVVLLLGGCGGKSGNTEAFASKFCTAFGAWFGGITQENQKVNSTLGPNARPKEAKRRLHAFFDAVVKDTDQFLRSINSAGVPDVEGGDRFVAQMKESFGKFKATYERARDQVDGLPSEPAAFKSGVTKLTNTLQSSLSGVNEAFNRPPSNEIRQAFEKSPDCRRLRGNPTAGASPGS